MVPQPPATACWRKSSWSGSGACVMAARTHDHIWVRDSRGQQQVLRLSHEGWAAFIAGVQRDELVPVC